MKIGQNSQECVRIVCNVCEGVCECVELRTPNVLAGPVSTLPQTPLDINETEEHVATCTYTSFLVAPHRGTTLEIIVSVCQSVS